MRQHRSVSTLVDARDVRENTPKPGTVIFLGSVGNSTMEDSMAFSSANMVSTKRLGRNTFRTLRTFRSWVIEQT